MREILLWTILAGFLFLVFLFFIIAGLNQRDKRKIFISLVSIFLAFCIGALIVYKFATKSYDKLTSALKPRSGTEIYTALFGRPEGNCMEVLNKADQVVPRLDCCIWLEWRTCPAELARVILQGHYKSAKYASLDTVNYIPNYSPRPQWWTPHHLGDSVTVMRDFDFNNPNRDKILIFPKDSSHVFYCDMAD